MSLILRIHNWLEENPPNRISSRLDLYPLRRRHRHRGRMLRRRQGRARSLYRRRRLRRRADESEIKRPGAGESGRALEIVEGMVPLAGHGVHLACEFAVILGLRLALDGQLQLQFPLALEKIRDQHPEQCQARHAADDAPRDRGCGSTSRCSVVARAF